MIEDVTIAGIGGFKSFTYSHSIDEPAASFSIDTSARPSAGLRERIATSDQATIEVSRRVRQRLIEVKASGDLLLTGYADGYQVQGNTEGRALSISGRSKTSTAIDSQTAGAFQNVSGKQIIERLLTPYGIELESDISDWQNFEHFVLRSGTTVMGAVQNVLRMQQASGSVTTDGKFKIWDAQSASRKGSVSIGGGIKSYSVKFADFERFSDVIAKGQDVAFFQSSQASEIAATASVRDLIYRTRYIYPRGAVDTPKVREAAQREIKRQLGKGAEVTVELSGWRASDGSFYQPNQKLFVEIEPEGIAADLVIKSVELSQSLDAGTTSSLTLAPIAAFNKSTKPKAKTVTVGDNVSPAAAVTAATPQATNIGDYPSLEFDPSFEF